MKRRILIALSTSRYSKKLIATALEEAQKWCTGGDEVIVDVLYIIEVEELKQISDRVGNEAFLGTTMQQELLEALGQEHHRMALRRIEELNTQAEAAGNTTHWMAPKPPAVSTKPLPSAWRRWACSVP